MDPDEARTVRHHGPGAAGYAERVEVASGKRLVSATLAGIAVETAALVGR